MNIYRSITIVSAVAAGIMLLAAAVGAFARVTTGARPTSTGVSKPFGANTSAGLKGVGGETNTNIGGSAGAIPPQVRHHYHGRPRG